MSAGDISCQLVAALTSRWHSGELSDVRTDDFEQHLLVCPPCLTYSAKLRLALAALAGAAAGEPSDGYVARVIGSAGGPGREVG